MPLQVASTGRPLALMVKIEAVIQPTKLDDVKATMRDLGIQAIISEVMNHGGPNVQKAFYRGAEYSLDAPMLKLEMLVSSERADEVIGALSGAARTRLPGDDGHILIYEVADAIRIRNGVHLQFTLS